MKLKDLNKLILEAYSQAIIKKLIAKFQAETPELTPDTITWYIQRFDQVKASPRVQEKDIFKYSFIELERAVDSFVTKADQKAKKDGPKADEGNADLIYDKSNVVIFKGDNKEKCIMYGKGYSWCIGRTDSQGGNMYSHYRINHEKSFYFVFNKNLPTEDNKHAVVIHANPRGGYSYSLSHNPGDTDVDSWLEIERMFPWLKGLQELFGHIEHSAREKVLKDGLTAEVIASISYDDLVSVMAGYASDDEIFRVLQAWDMAIIKRFGEKIYGKLLNDVFSASPKRTNTEWVLNYMKYAGDYPKLVARMFSPENVKAMLDDENASYRRADYYLLRRNLIPKEYQEQFFERYGRYALRSTSLPFVLLLDYTEKPGDILEKHKEYVMECINDVMISLVQNDMVEDMFVDFYREDQFKRLSEIKLIPKLKNIVADLKRYNAPKRLQYTFGLYVKEKMKIFSDDFETVKREIVAISHGHGTYAVMSELLPSLEERFDSRRIVDLLDIIFKNSRQHPPFKAVLEFLGTNADYWISYLNSGNTSFDNPSMYMDNINKLTKVIEHTGVHDAIDLLPFLLKKYMHGLASKFVEEDNLYAFCQMLQQNTENANGKQYQEYFQREKYDTISKLIEADIPEKYPDKEKFIKIIIKRGIQLTKNSPQ